MTDIVAKTKDRISRRTKGFPAWARWSVSAYPPGHYHSPLPDVADALREPPRPLPESVPGIDNRHEAQLALADTFAGFAAEMPFGPDTRHGLRYRLTNEWFAHGDGVALYSMLRHLRPRRYIEVGSGFSSACALDTAERFLDNAMEFTFFEPNPQRLRSLLRPGEPVTIIERPPAHYSIEHFAELEAGDILFIDSSHVTKFGSEVNDLLLDVIPQLPVGVHIHIHDIYWPFTYPLDWIKRRRAWNEAYLLRGLLCDNPRLRITWFNDYLAHRARPEITAALSAWAPDPGGSIWIERI